MLYTLHIHHRKLIVPALLVLFLLLSVVGYGQNNEDYNNCTDNTNHPIISSWIFPDTVCADSDNTYTIGYGTSNNIVIAQQDTSVTTALETVIPDNNNENNCICYSPITYFGFLDTTIRNINDIQYVRLNIAHELAVAINIRLICPNDTVNILYQDGEFAPLTCAPDITGGAWQGQNCDESWPAFGEAINNLGWNYCWSDNNSSNYTYAFGDGIIYREENGQNNVVASNAVCGDGSFDSTHISSNEQFYHPDEPFSNLIGCHINGTWTIEIIDFSSNDNEYSANLFDWEIKFADGVLQPAGNSVNGAAVLTADGQVDTNFPVSFEESDTTIVFHAPTVSHDTTFTRTLRLYDSTGCWYDTVFSITVLAPHDTDIYVNRCADDLPYSFSGNAFNGRTFETTGIYTDTLSSLAINGCDSIIRLHFNVIDPPSVTISAFPNTNEICEGDVITLTAISDCINDTILDENFSSLQNICPACSDATNSSASSTPLQPTDFLPSFPTRKKAFPAGTAIKLGSGQFTSPDANIGSLTSSNQLDLSHPFCVRLHTKGFGNLHGKIIVSVNETNEQAFITNNSGWPGTYTETTLYFPAATSSSTITIRTDTITPQSGNNITEGYRAFIDDISIYRQCHYQWNTGVNDTTATITVTPSQDSTYTVTVTNDAGCSSSENFYVTVRPKPVITFDACSGRGTSVDTMHMRCQNGITLPAAVPCAADYEFVGWSTVPVDPTNSEPSLFHAGDNYLSDTDITLHAVYRKCTPTGNTKYSLVTSDTNDWSGNYLIVYTNKVFDGSLTSLDVTQNYQDEVNINNDIITLSSNQNYYFTIEPKTGGYSIRSASGIFIGKKTSSNNKIDTTRTYTNDFRNSIEYINNNDIRIKGIVDKYLRFNNENSQNRFRYYNEETFQPVQLYRGEPEMNCEYTSCPPLPHGDTTVIACGSFT